MSSRDLVAQSWPPPPHELDPLFLCVDVVVGGAKIAQLREAGRDKNPVTSQGTDTARAGEIVLRFEIEFRPSLRTTAQDSGDS